MKRQVSRSVDRTRRDLANRTHGLKLEVQSLTKSEPVAHEVVEARVHSRLGRLVSNPHEVEVALKDGVVTLRGPVLESEVKRLVSGVEAVAGVRGVENRLRVFRHASDAPGLREGRGPSRRWLKGRLSPAARFLLGAGGGLLGLTGMLVAGKRGALGAAMTVSGAGMLVRGIGNKQLSQLAGVTSRAWEVNLRRTLNLAVPVEKVFEFWANYRNFPRFMAHLKEVRDLGNGRSHWIAAGPAGMPLEWTAEITRLEPNAVIAWQSVPVSMIENEGEVTFHGNPDGTTRLDIHLSYNPPAGSAGQLIGRLLGGDPQQALNDDLLRLKSLLEAGKARLHGETVTREELPGIAKTLVPASHAV